MFFNDYYNSPIGNITMASDGESLCGLWFDGQKYFASTVKGETEDKTLPVFEQTKKWLDIYFSGNEPDFIPKLFSCQEKPKKNGFFYECSVLCFRKYNCKDSVKTLKKSN